MRRILPLLATLILAGSAHADIIIDNFEQGGFSFSAGNIATSETQMGLFPLLTIGGQRGVVIRSEAPGETVSTELVLTPDDDAVGHESDTSGGRFSIAYGDFGLASFDLTEGGLADRIEVVVVKADAPATLELAVLDASSGGAAPSQLIDAPGTYTFLFSSIAGVDLTDVQILQVDLETAASGTFGITEIVATGPPPVPGLTSPGIAVMILVLVSSALLATADRRNTRPLQTHRYQAF